MLEVLRQAADIVGNVSLLAEGIGAPRTSVYAWDRVPSGYCIPLTELTGIPLYEIRPDLYPKSKVKSKKSRRGTKLRRKKNARREKAR